MILQESAAVVVVGGAAWEAFAKLYYCRARQVEVCYLGAVTIKPVEIVLEILLEAGQLQRHPFLKLFVRCKRSHRNAHPLAYSNHQAALL